MRKYGKYLLTVLFIALIVEIVLVAPMALNLDKELEEPAPQVAEGQPEANQTMRGGHVVVTRDEEKEWELWSEHALGFQEKGFWALEKVKAKFFAKDGVSFTVTGDKGTVELESKNMTIEGDVRTISSNGYLYKTEKVEYKSSDRRLFSPTKVTMIGPKDKAGHPLKLTGDHMEAHMGETVMRVIDQVMGSKLLEDERRVRISSDVAEFSGQAKTAKFMGDVIIDVESMRISGPEAKFLYDSDSENLLRSIEVKGGVRVSDAQKWATSDKVNIGFDKDEVVFSGNPRVVQDDDELRGERIIFSNGGRRVQVQKARAKVGKDSVETYE